MIDAALHRALRTIESAQGPTVTLDGREVLLLCSNDYLGLAGDPRLREAAAEAAARWGAGAGASPLVSGHMGIHRELEARLAELKGTEACVLFGSGLPGQHRRDRGARAPTAWSPATSSTTRRSSTAAGSRARRRACIAHGEVPRGADVIVTDAVFRMDGDVAPLVELVETGARVIVDEAHATGVIGAEGRGLVHELGLQREVITVGTLGKALGSYGAFVCCDARTADHLVNRARTLIYSTALPPPSVGAALRALELMDRERVGRGCTPTRACCARRSASSRPTMPIVPLVLGSPEAALEACASAARGRRLRAGDPAADGAAGHARGCGSSPPRRTTPATCAARRLLQACAGTGSAI